MPFPIKTADGKNVVKTLAAAKARMKDINAIVAR